MSNPNSVKRQAVDLVRKIRARKRITHETASHNGHIQRKKTWSMTEEEAAQLLAAVCDRQKWDAEQDAKDQRARVVMLDRWIEKQEAAVARWWAESRKQRTCKRSADRDIKARGTRITALESLHRVDAKTQERMRARLDKYEDTDWRQKEQLTEQAETITRLRGGLETIDEDYGGTDPELRTRIYAALTGKAQQEKT